jgi:hypothetical protein
LIAEKTMRKNSLLVIAAVCLSALSHGDALAERRQCEAAKLRTIRFLTNAHTGKPMQAKQWFTAAASAAPMFAGFGGIKALVEQSTAHAEKYDGFGSVTVLSAKRVGRGCEVSAEVKFKKDHKDIASTLGTDHEDMVWTFQFVRQNGVWKINA